MAALCPGVQYGLSTEENFSENKVLIFVKLTDSAYGTVQQHLKNQSKFSKNPTIKFLGTEGQLCFPLQQNESKSFKFSMSSTADMEGLGGSFECVQQSGPPRGSLQALGAIPYKIRIHASDDVYETTRMRMTEAEEIHKNKCTREIKPNQTDIGRKVKVKQVPGRPLPPHRRDIQLPRENLVKPSYQSSNVPSKPVVVHSNGVSNGLGNNHVSSTRPKPSMPDIARRPLKERLIHLLALRPYKKPEILERLTREGLREKNGVTSVLKQVALLKDNAFHLNRAMWNDVHENWPFYTESEKQTLKRRKPQNLTPPDSSDGGSSGSGHSPTSTHPGSPPPTITLPKRPSNYYDGNDGLPRKRVRISHVPKFAEQSPYRSPIENNSQRRPITDSRDASNMNPRSRESPINDYSNSIIMSTTAPTNPPTTNNYYGMLNDKQQQRHYNSDDDDNTTSSTNNTNSITNSSNNSKNNNNNIATSNIITTNNTNNHNSSSSNNSNSGSSMFGNNKRSCDSLNGLKYGVSRMDNSGSYSSSLSSKNLSSNKDTNVDVSRIENVGKNSMTETTLGALDVTSTASGERIGNKPERERTRWSQVTSTTQNRVAQVSPDSQSERISTTDSVPPREDAGDRDTEYPTYLTEYTTIRDSEQRRRYKTDFSADYDEYKRLHGIVEQVSRRFAELEERLKRENSSSATYKSIRKQIMSEYQQNKRDQKHQQAKRRFQHLHDKLSHIKRLVLEYDQGISENNQY